MKRVVIDSKERFPDYYFSSVRESSDTTGTVEITDEQLVEWHNAITTYNRVQAEIKAAFITSKIAKAKSGKP